MAEALGVQHSINSNDAFAFNLYNYGGQGQGEQRLETGFDVYPGDFDYDYFWFHFELDMPAEFMQDGEILY